jgi:hypothetical protein
VADRVFGPHTNSDEVYEVAAKPVVKAAMEGVNGRKFYYIDLKLCRNGNVMFLAMSNLVSLSESFYYFDENYFM